MPKPTPTPAVQTPPSKPSSKRLEPAPPPPIAKPRGERPRSEKPSRKHKSVKSIEPKAAPNLKPTAETPNPNIFAELAARERANPRPATPKAKMNPYWLWGGSGALVVVCIGIIILGIVSLKSPTKAAKKKKENPAAVEKSASPEQEKQKPPEKEQKEKKAAPVVEDKPRPASNALDPAYIPPECNAAFVIHPARMLRSESPLLPPAKMRAALLDQVAKAAGIDPRKIEQAIVLVDPFPGGNVLFFPAGIFRFAGAVEGKKILGGVLKETEEAKAEGKTYSRSKTEKMAKTPLAGYVADPRTILLAPEPTLKKMLAAGSKSKNPLFDRLSKLDLGNDISGAFLVAPIRPVLAQMEKSPDIPPNLAGLKSLHKTLEAVTLTVNIDKTKLIEIVLHGSDGAAAGELEKLVKAALDMGKQAYGGVRKNMQKQLMLDLPPDLASKLVRVADQIDKGGIKVTKKGKDVIVTLEKPKDL